VTLNTGVASTSQMVQQKGVPKAVLSCDVIFDMWFLNVTSVGSVQDNRFARVLVRCVLVWL